MDAHKLLMRDPLPPPGPFRNPEYDAGAERPVGPRYVLSDDGTYVYRIDRAGKIFVPLIPLESHDLPRLAVCLIRSAAAGRAGLALEARSVREAVAAGEIELFHADLMLGAILVHTGTDVSGVDRACAVSFHDDVEPGLVICLSDPEFLGRMPTGGEASFGMMISNDRAVVPVRVVP